MNLKLLLIILLPFIGLGQNLDKVYLNNKEVISGKVLRVTDKSVEIDPKGDKPFLIIKRSDVSVLIYADNTVINFEKNENISATKENSAIEMTDSFSESLYFEIPKMDSNFKSFGYILDETIEFVDRNGLPIKVHLDGSFSYGMYFVDHKNAWHVTIKKPQIVAAVEYGKRKEIATILRLEDKKKNWRGASGHIGDFPFYSFSDISVGDYNLDFFMTKVHINRFRIDLNLSPK